MATYLADKVRLQSIKGVFTTHILTRHSLQVVVFEGEPSQRAVATRPQTLLTGMNRFLKNLDITFRRDPNNYRPRINKMDSVKDVEQKRSGASLALTLSILYDLDSHPDLQATTSSSRTRPSNTIEYVIFKPFEHLFAQSFLWNFYVFFSHR